jgi:hypothetical protein
LPTFLIATILSLSQFKYMMLTFPFLRSGTIFLPFGILYTVYSHFFLFLVTVIF